MMGFPGYDFLDGEGTKIKQAQPEKDNKDKAAGFRAQDPAVIPMSRNAMIMARKIPGSRPAAGIP